MSPAICERVAGVVFPDPADHPFAINEAHRDRRIGK
jgi:hypothetical protein